MKKMKQIVPVLMALAVGVTVIGVTGCNKSETKSESSGGNQARQYTCSMHPEVVQDKPGKCPKCGMELTEKK